MSLTIPQTAIRYGLRAGAAGVTGGLAFGFYLYETDPGTKRMFEAYSTFAPVVLHFRWTEWKDKVIPVSEEEWEALDKRYASSTVAKLGELQGMYAKYGQTAAGLTNTLGDAWIEELRKLENNIPPRPVEAVYKTIEEETGKAVSETFDFLDPVPLGSASIGQVHRAILKDGREVAVKVQYNEAKELFQKDIHTIRGFCELLAPEHVCTMEALEKQNQAEMDYEKEATNLKQISNNMKRHGFMPREIVVPQPIFSTRRILIMELLPGPKLIDGIKAYYSTWAKLNGTTLQELEMKTRKKIEEEGILAKYNGPSAFQVNIYRRLLQVRCAIWNGGIFIYNSTIGHSKPFKYKESSLPPNIPRIVDTLMQCHGYQLLVDGMFNADPHGGNFLLLPDGRIGFIDYGATKELTRNERLTACVLYAALARRDQEMLCQMAEVGGFKSKYGNKDVWYKLQQFGYDSWGRDVTGNKNVQQFIDELKAKDPWTETPDNFVMASFMSIRLRSLSLGMNCPVRCSDWWGSIAEEELKRHGLPYESWDREQLIKYKPEVSLQKFSMG